jgi:aryl-alcohol dehydrogenase-like predicted oxidoreductase
VLYWGVSEWSHEQIEEAVRLAGERGAYRPISSQPQYSILRRAIERRVLKTCAKHGIGQIVWSPLAQGVLTGKYAAGTRPEGTRAAHPFQSRFMEAFLTEEMLAKVEKLRPLAASLDLSMGQLAIAWCLRQENVASAIVGATRPEQIQENAKASGVALPGEVLAKIDALFPLQARG